jgi:hypothetical protein
MQNSYHFKEIMNNGGMLNYIAGTGRIGKFFG